MCIRDRVRIISPEYSGGDTLCFHNIEKTYWYAPNIIRKVTANDITRIDLVRDKALGHSSKIQIPIGGNEIYKVTISEGGSAKFLRIDITKRTPHAVKYVFASPAPETVPAPVDPAKDVYKRQHDDRDPVSLFGQRRGPFLRLDGHSGHQRPFEPAAPVLGAYLRPSENPEHGDGGHHRYDPPAGALYGPLSGGCAPEH